MKGDNFMNIFSNKVNEIKTLENELIHSLEDNVYGRRKQAPPASVDFYNDVNAKRVYSTLSPLIKLLSRKRHNNALHMYMIMFLSEELSKYVMYQFNNDQEDFKIEFLAKEAELLILDLYNIMELAENKTKGKKFSIDEKYIFKDEKNIIRTNLELLTE